MALPVHPNKLSIAQIKSEFKGSNKFSDYYAGKSFVRAGTVGFPVGKRTLIPANGVLRVGNFHGAERRMFDPVSFDYRYRNNGGSYRPGVTNLNMVWRTPDVTVEEYNSEMARQGLNYPYGEAMIVETGSLIYLRCRFNSDDENTIQIVSLTPGIQASPTVHAQAGSDCNGRSGDANKTEAHIFYGASINGSTLSPIIIPNKKVFFTRTVIRKTGSLVNNSNYELMSHVTRKAFQDGSSYQVYGLSATHTASTYSLITNSARGRVSANPEAYELNGNAMVVKKALIVGTNVNTKGSPNFAGGSNQGVGDILRRCGASLTPNIGQLERYGAHSPGIIGMRRYYIINPGTYVFDIEANVLALWAISA